MIFGGTTSTTYDVYGASSSNQFLVFGGSFSSSAVSSASSSTATFTVPNAGFIEFVDYASSTGAAFGFEILVNGNSVYTSTSSSGAGGALVSLPLNVGDVVAVEVPTAVGSFEVGLTLVLTA